ncbi:MAG: FAD-binding oxidoreductase, partial [Actinomycetota bacterium]|nr:FAD-binding oxidoreductase [Actinomycetota bacterium]
MRHTRHGWWLEEAGEVIPTRPLEGDAAADVVIVGGGYLGLWTAWQLLELEPSLDVLVLESEVCGHGPSGRNGGFCETLWPDAPTLREHAGDEAALTVCRASEDAVRGIGAWCEAQDVDAWYRAAPMLRVATTESQLDSWAEVVRAAAALGEAEQVVALDAGQVRAACNSPLFLGGARFRLNATVQPARLALGLRARLLERGVRIHERTLVRKLHREGGVETRTGRIRAGSTVLAVNSRTSAFPGYRLSLAAASSHIVLSEPVPEVIEELGWTEGEAIVDSRTLVHYMRTTQDGRIAFGWGGGTMGFDGKFSRRQELDRKVIARTRES